MAPLVRENRYSGLGHHAKVHSFRILTVVLAWLILAARFLPKNPNCLRGFSAEYNEAWKLSAIVFRLHGGPRN